MNLISLMSAYFIGVIVLFVLARMILKEADTNLQAEELPGGALRFGPDQLARIAMAVFIGGFGVVGVLGTVSALFGGRGLAMSLFCLAVALLLLRFLPGTLLLTKEGLEQHVWLGSPKKIAWSEVQSVTVVKREGRVVILGTGGRKIQHAKQLPDRDRLLAELRAHCPDKMPGATITVAAGHRDWMVPPPPPKD